MKILDAIKAASHAFKATVTPGPNYANGDPAYWTDWFRNGWAAVAAGWGALLSSLRDWGATSYAGLAADAAANPHTARALRLICDNGAAVKVIAYKPATRDGDEDEADPDNAALQAIERTGWDELWTPFAWGMYCAGEVFFRKLAPMTGDNAGVARRIQVLRTERFVDIVYDRDGEPREYRFARPAGLSGYDSYPADEVRHIRLFNPETPDRGLPILVGARRALTLVAEADAWNRGISKGGGVVPGYLSPSEKMLEQFNGQIPIDKVRETQEYSDRVTLERRQSNLPQVLSGSFTYQSNNLTPKDADWLRGRQVAMREIAAVMGVPATLLADEKGGSLTDAGVDSEVSALYKLTIQPLVMRLLRELTDWLAPEGTRLDADWDQVPALQEDIDAKFTRYAAAVEAGLLTQKEGRVAVGYDPAPKPEMVDAVETETVDAIPDAMPDEQPDESETVKALRDLPESFWGRFDPETLAA